MAISKARRKSSFAIDGSPIIITEPNPVEMAPVLNTADSNRQVFKATDPGGFTISYDINYFADSSKLAYTNDSSNLPPHLLHPAQITTTSDSAGLSATYRFLTRVGESDGSGNSTVQRFLHKYIASDGLRNISTTKAFQFRFVASEAEVLIIGGGGGGGGWAGGGGGAGAARYYSAFSITEGQAYTVTIGTGGQGASPGANADQASGVASVWAGFTAGPGGYGGDFTVSGKSPGGHSGGGSPGGGAYNQGGVSDPGDYGSASGSGLTSPYSGGGGGGATGAGVNASGQTSGTGGDGGAGLTSSITGVSVVYAEGGGGGIVSNGDAYPTLGGGTAGAGSRGGGTAAGEDGLANTGSGGGGAGATSSSGGSNQGGGDGAAGVCIIAYPSRFAAPTITNGLTYTSLTSRTGYKVYKFTAGTGTVTF